MRCAAMHYIHPLILILVQSCLQTLKCSGCNNLQEVVIQLPPTCPLAELVSFNLPDMSSSDVPRAKQFCFGISLKCEYSIFFYST